MHISACSLLRVYALASWDVKIRFKRAFFSPSFLSCRPHDFLPRSLLHAVLLGLSVATSRFPPRRSSVSSFLPVPCFRSFVHYSNGCSIVRDSRSPTRAAFMQSLQHAGTCERSIASGSATSRLLTRSNEKCGWMGRGWQRMQPHEKSILFRCYTKIGKFSDFSQAALMNC